MTSDTRRSVFRRVSLVGVIAMVTIKRVYEAPDAADGQRFLIDRLWPRGISKAKAQLDGWLRDVAPSTGLRQWFGHDPALWPEFQRRYRTELDGEPERWRPLLDAAQKGDVTLVYAARDQEHNDAVVLRQYLLEKLSL